MTGSKHNREGNSSNSGEPDPGPYWRRMHYDWCFWVGAVLMITAIAIYVLSGDLAWVPRGMTRHSLPQKNRRLTAQWVTVQPPYRFDVDYGMVDNRIRAARLDLPDHLPAGTDAYFSKAAA